MEIKFEWVNPRSGRKAGSGTVTGVMVTHGEYKGVTGDQVAYTQIRIAADLMKKCRFVIGDRIAVGTGTGDDGKLYMAVRRVLGDQPGYKLSNPEGRTATGRGDKAGTAKMKRKDWPAVSVSTKDCELTENGFVFCMSLCDE